MSLEDLIVTECPKCWSKRTWCLWVDEKTGRHERYCAKCQHEWQTYEERKESA